MDNVLKYLLNYALENKIGFITIPNAEPDWIPVAIPEKRLILVNMQWHNKKELPFMVAHELGHIMNEQPCSQYSSNTLLLKAERAADNFAIGLLIKYCQEDNISFNDPYNFMEQFAIPEKYSNQVLNSIA